MFKLNIKKYTQLFSIVFIFTCLSTLHAELINHSYPHGDGSIRLFNYHLNEFKEIHFRKEGKIVPEAIEEIRHILRSRDNNEIRSIDTKLIDLIDHLQDHFEADTVEIISGYRRKELNSSLLNSGHKVSPQSLHIEGKAIDIHIDEIREETLQAYLLSLKLGGVGYYGPLDFVHVDTGPFRRWGEKPNFSRKLIGVLTPEAPAQLTSNKNEYLPGEKLTFIWNFKPGYDESTIEKIQLEHFWRGEWRECQTNIKPQSKSLLPDSLLECPLHQINRSFGKYRWTFYLKENSEKHSSNEFYLKKK